jgi:four helix bundle protein
MRNAECGIKMNVTDLKLRTKQYALRVIRLVRSLPQEPVANVIGKQLVRSGTSVGANYRASCRAKSRADFVVKMNIVEEECDESLYWMELLIESGLVTESKLQSLMSEGDEILSIVVRSIQTAKSKLPARGSAKNPQSAIRNPQ